MFDSIYNLSCSFGKDWDGYELLLDDQYSSSVVLSSSPESTVEAPSDAIPMPFVVSFPLSLYTSLSLNSYIYVTHVTTEF